MDMQVIKYRPHPRISWSMARAASVLELDANLKAAMEKMRQMHEIEERLYGMDCGSCGAPSCKALAEDVVRGFAEENACIVETAIALTLPITVTHALSAGARPITKLRRSQQAFDSRGGAYGLPVPCPGKRDGV